MMMAGMISTEAMIEPGATLGEGCSVAAFAVVKSCARVGDNCHIDHHVVLGGLPQDIHFDASSETHVRIGNDCVIREGVTINRATRPGGATVVGQGCMLMANSHLGHDVQLGDHVILANGVLLAGHVVAGDHCFLGGNAVFHQYIRIGESAIISGGARVAHDVPPFVVAAERNQVAGLNLIGMKRCGLSSEEIQDVKACYKAVYFHPGSPSRKALAALESGLAKTDKGRLFLEFFKDSKRGFIRSSNEK